MIDTFVEGETEFIVHESVEVNVASDSLRHVDYVFPGKWKVLTNILTHPDKDPLVEIVAVVDPDGVYAYPPRDPRSAVQ